MQNHFTPASASFYAFISLTPFSTWLTGTRLTPHSSGLGVKEARDTRGKSFGPVRSFMSDYVI